MTGDEDLLSLLESSDGHARMLQLPPFAMRPSWASLHSDAAIGNWVAAWVDGERKRCVQAALAAVRCVVPRLPPDSEESAVTHDWIDSQIRAIELWIATPSQPNQELARASFDPTRQTHAWSDFDFVDAWIGEASDFSIHAIWSGDLKGYITPPSPQSCAALAAVCATRALILDGVEPNAAVLEIARAVAIS